jgi:hypothetical protein
MYNIFPLAQCRETYIAYKEKETKDILVLVAPYYCLFNTSPSIDAAVVFLRWGFLGLYLLISESWQKDPTMIVKSTS